MATPLAEARTRQFKQPQQAEAHLPATFDLDAFHAMQARDDQLVAQRAAHGVAGRVFIYSFSIKGTRVDGISVEGAHQLATIYGGIKHRIVATVEKRGPVFTFKSYPSESVPMNVAVNVVQELAGEDDFYSCVVEVTDLKSGNSFQVEKSETRFEQRQDGTHYERPNFQIIAQSKARRNGILLLVPGDVQEQFKARCLQAGQSIDIGSDVFQAKYAGVTRFAASRGIAIDRRAIQGLTLEQITGLGEAARSNDLDAFREALDGLSLASASEDSSSAGHPRPDTHHQGAGGSPAEAAKDAAAEEVYRGPPDDQWGVGEFKDEGSAPKRRGRPPGSSNRPKPPRAMDQDSGSGSVIPAEETVDEDTGEVTKSTQAKPPFEE